MTIFNNYWFYVILYLFFDLIFANYYKIASHSGKNDGALTSLLQLLAGIIVLIFCPLFEYKLPNNISVYIFLGLAVIFYASSDRVGTTARKGIYASTYTIINQLTTVFMIFAGLVFFREKFILTKFIGAFLIVFSNVLVFLEKGKLVFNKSAFLGVISCVFFAGALFLDVNIGNSFNLAFYISLTLVLPALLIAIIERFNFKTMKEEYIYGNRKAIIFTSSSWGVLIIVMLKAYQLGRASVIAPLLAVSVMVNVIFGYFFFKEKDNLLKKIIAAIIVIIGIILINS